MPIDSGPAVEYGQLAKDDDDDDARPELELEAIYVYVRCTLVGPTPTSNRIELVTNGVPMMCEVGGLGLRGMGGRRRGRRGVDGRGC